MSGISKYFDEVEERWDEYFDLRDVVDRVPIPVDGPDPAPPRKVTYLLGGGGAKGCFQAGALGFLAEIEEDENLQPDLVCGTSVGALNGILTTENANVRDNRRIIDLIDIWLSLENSDDFFVINPAVERLNDDLPDYLQNLTGIDVEDTAYDYFGGGYNLHPDEVPIWDDKLVGRSVAFDNMLKGLAIAGAPGWGRIPGVLEGTFLLGGVTFDMISDAIEEGKNIRALFSLSPLKDLLEDNIDIGNLYFEPEVSDEAALNIDRTLLRMVSVDARTGNVCWVNNRGQLKMLNEEKLTERVYDDPVSIDTYDELYGKGVFAPDGRRMHLEYAQVIVEGALSSAAIPLVFPPGVFYLTEDFVRDPESAVTLFDGGVRDVLPTQAAESFLLTSHEAGFENYEVTISNQPMFDNSGFFEKFERQLQEIERPDTYDPEEVYWNLTEEDVRSYWGEGDWSGTHIVDLTLRAIGLLQDEVRRGDPLDILSLDIPTERLVIAPTFSVNDTPQIDVGLIRIALAYGWMRACDMIFLKHRREKYESGSLAADEAFTPFLIAYDLTDIITRLRMNCWRHEMRMTPVEYGKVETDLYEDLGVEEVIFEAGVIDLLRDAKRRLAGRIAHRKALLSSFRYPEFPESEYMRGETPDDWLDFEPHSPESYWFFDEDERELAETTIEFMSEPGRLWSDTLFGLDRRGWAPAATRPSIP